MTLIRFIFDRLAFWWMWTDRPQRIAWRIALSVASSSFFLSLHGLLMHIKDTIISNFSMIAIGASIIFVCSVLFEQTVNSKRELQEMYEKLEEKNKKLQEIALRDSLTGLYNNRDFMNDTIKMLMARAKRKDGSVYLLFADIDDLKIINDSYDHTVGDHAIIAAAETFKSSLREEDSVFRYGGDEFLAIFYVEKMPEAEANETINITIKRVLQNIESIRIYGEHKKTMQLERIKVSMSIGKHRIDIANDYKEEVKQASNEMAKRKTAMKMSRSQEIES